MTPVDDLVAWLTQIWDHDVAKYERATANPYSRYLLAHIAADRQILALHKPSDYEGIGVLCGCCEGGAGAGPPWPCQTVRLLAEPYADHEGFRDEWRVTAFERWLADE